MVNTFKYVYVPCEPHKAIEERTFTGVAELGNDGFIESVKQHFSNSASNLGKNGGASDKDMLKEQLKKHNPKLEDTLTDDMMQQVMNMTTVDIFPVMLPKKPGFKGVSFYVDDKGISRGLPLNERVTSLAHTAGYPEQTFYGDAFISRVFDDEDAWERIDFTEKECSSSADWLDETKKQRACKKTKSEVDNFRKMMNGESAPPMSGNNDANKVDEGETEKYSWRDNDGEEIEVSFKTAEKITKKDVKVAFQQRRVKVVIKEETLFDSELNDAIEIAESSWSIMDGKLQVTLMKKKEGRWKTLIKEEL